LRALNKKKNLVHAHLKTVKSNPHEYIVLLTFLKLGSYDTYTIVSETVSLVICLPEQHVLQSRQHFYAVF